MFKELDRKNREFLEEYRRMIWKNVIPGDNGLGDLDSVVWFMLTLGYDPAQTDDIIDKIRAQHGVDRALEALNWIQKEFNVKKVTANGSSINTALYTDDHDRKLAEWFYLTSDEIRSIGDYLEAKKAQLQILTATSETDRKKEPKAAGIQRYTIPAVLRTDRARQLLEMAQNDGLCVFDGERYKWTGNIPELARFAKRAGEYLGVQNHYKVFGDLFGYGNTVLANNYNQMKQNGRETVQRIEILFFDLKSPI